MHRINLDEYIGTLSEDLTAQSEQDGQARLFEQYVTRTGAHPEAREKFWAAYKTGAPLTGLHGLRKQLGAIDLEYFGRAYLSHYFTKPSPAFHGELDQIWTGGVLKGLDPIAVPNTIDTLDGCHWAIAAPRGHAKSTNLTFKGSLHAIVYSYKHYLLILSDSSDQAETFLGDIRTELEDNPQIREDFGMLQGERIWKSNVLITSTDIKVEGIGSGKKVRGRRHRNWRPDLILLDDVENDENVATLEQRTKLENWFKKAVSKAGDRYTDIICIGTMLHFDSLLAKVMKMSDYRSRTYQAVIRPAVNLDLWNQWEELYTDLSDLEHAKTARHFFELHQEKMLEGAMVLWPEKMDYYKLMTIKTSEGEAAFNSELQNNPLDPASCAIREEWLEYWDDAPPDFSDPRFVLVAANDPSLGKSKTADTSSLIGIAKDTHTGYLYVIEGSVERRTPDVIMDDAIEMQRRAQRDYHKGYAKFGVETVQFQYFFAKVLAEKSRQQGVYLPIEEINNRQSKDIRILSLQPLIKNRYIKFSRRHKTLLQQLLEYPNGRNDDGPDGLEMAVRLAMAVGSTASGYQSIEHRAARFKKGCY